MLLKDRKILITNATHFAGVPGTAHMINEGATVIAHDKAFTDAGKRDAFVGGRTGVIAIAGQTPEEIVAEAIGAAGHIDVLVNNDAYPAIRARVEEAKLDDMRGGLEEMVVAPFARSGTIVPHFKERGAGKLIFLTSATAFVGLVNYSMYVTARAGAHGLVLSLAKELAPHNIQVNAIAPNFVESPDYFPEDLLANEEAYRKITKNIPLGRLGKPEEIAAAIAFYASDRSDFITGNLLPFAGGWA